ncbi:MAG TPA: hypothetical protein PKZ62_06175, partial [Thermoclostridium caenicola]|nr:hypothetical protein [Thermoclostridium caenicola]
DQIGNVSLLHTEKPLFSLCFIDLIPYRVYNSDCTTVFSKKRYGLYASKVFLAGSVRNAYRVQHTEREQVLPEDFFTSGKGGTAG